MKLKSIEKVSTLINDYFVSVFNKTDIDYSKLKSTSAINSQVKSIDNITITVEEVSKSLGELKKNKSPGNDEINSTYILGIKDIIAKPLQLIFNKSIDQNQVPNDWKTANITPIFKKGDKSNVENYRPVSLTSILGKSLEKIIKKHIADFLNDTNQIKTTQHGFTQGRSCLSNLLICHDSIINRLDEGKAVDVIYLDLQKAFDKVQHKLLMYKIRNMGIVGKLADWIETWLVNRKQRVTINGAKSEWKTVYSGVPQGSVLGPLLFSIFINDIDDKLKNCILKFADDSKLWGIANEKTGRETLQEDLDTLSDWSKKKLHAL